MRGPALPFARRFVVFLFLLARNGIDTAKPAMQINICATFRAEWAVLHRLRMDSTNHAKRIGPRLGLRIFRLIYHFRWNRLPLD